MARRAFVLLMTVVALTGAAKPSPAYNGNPWHLIGYGDTPGVHVDLDVHGETGLIPLWIGVGTGSLTLGSGASLQRRSLIVHCTEVLGDGEPDTWVAGMATDSTGQDWSFSMYFYQQTTRMFELKPTTGECQPGAPFQPNGIGSFTVNGPLL